MKLSIYNTVVRIGDDKIVVYNGMTDNFVVATATVLPSVDIDLNSLEPELSSRLRSIGAIVDDNVDEVAMLAKRIEEIDNDDSVFNLHINPTMFCNFKCWYCYEHHHANTMMGNETISATMKFIEQCLNCNDNLKLYKLSFFGGEPLLCFDSVCKPIITYMTTLCHEKGVDYGIHFTANGYLVSEKIVNFLEQYENVGFQITLDGGRQHHDKVRFIDECGTYSKILANVRMLVKAGISVVLRINYTRENVDSISSVIEDIRDFREEERKYIHIDFQRVWQDVSARDSISERIFAYSRNLKSIGYSVSTHYVFNMVNDSCYGDKRNNLLINYNGDVFNCTAREFTKSNRSGCLAHDGSVVWDNCYIERLMGSKFSKKCCHTCRIAPLCGGGCRRQAMDHSETDECLYGYTEEQMDDIVLKRFEYRYLL